jgi:hypothetical protein
MVICSASKIQPTVGGVCSYCGTRKNSTCERLIYQKICIRFNAEKNLAITICEDCCSKLNAEPGNTLNLNVLAPLITSLFWDADFTQPRRAQAKEALRNSLLYHGLKVPTKKGDKTKTGIEPKIAIPDKIAVNNGDEPLKNAKNVICQLYNLFLFMHSSLSVKDTLLNALQIAVIFWNSKDDKTR